MTLDLANIQGNILPGFNKDHQAFLLVAFRDSLAGKRWLSALQSDVASAAEVLAFKDLFEKIRARRHEHPTDRDSGALTAVSATWINVALSFRGLEILGGAADNTDVLGVAFRVNRLPGVQPQTAQSGIHALLIIAADQVDDLEATLDQERKRMLAHNVQEVGCFRGDTLPDEPRGHEHFGFADGVSQPRIAGTSVGDGPPVAPGEFVLGYPDETGLPSGAGLPDWALDGSFLVFLQLQQEVEAFRAAMSRNAAQLRLPPKELASRIVGRHVDGSSVEPPSRLSHIGRAAPHWLPGNEWLRHRLIRRGIPYGRPLEEGQPDDGQRGLFFICYQADIARQFEFVWVEFLNGPDFPTPGAGRDALTGLLHYSGAAAPAGHSFAGDSIATDGRPASAAAGQKGTLISLRLPAFVTPRYGGYFFTPSISALTELGKEPRANIPTGATQPERPNYPSAQPKYTRDPRL